MAAGISTAAIRVYKEEMKTSLSVAAALLFLTVRPALAQARPTCQVRPTTLAAMRSCYRPLLVFSPRPDDARLRKRQASLLDRSRR